MAGAANVKKAFHVQVAENLIEQLKNGMAPWQRPWELGGTGSYMPLNPTTGKRYRGINAIHLMSQGFIDQRWMTYKQAQAVGAQVRKGEHGTSIQYWKFTEERIKKDEQGKAIRGSDGEPLKEVISLERPRAFFASVFNAEQIDGLEPIPHKEASWGSLERAEQILQSTGAMIRYGGDKAFYRLSTDHVQLPDKGQFPNAAKYYATALHEIGHWTGHPSRLGRDLAHPFGSELYAKEELRAEIASMIMGDELGIGHDPGQHVAYVGSWIKALQNDPLELFRAAADAEKIYDYIMDVDREKNKSKQPIVQSEEVSDISVQQLEEYVVTEINARIERLRPSQEARKVISEVESTDSAISTILNNHISVNTPGYAKALESIDYGNIRERVTGIRYIPTFLEDAKALSEAVNTERTANSEKVMLNVPYKEKNIAKELGAKWDRQEQSWYVPAGADPGPFAQWMPKQQTAELVSEGSADNNTSQAVKSALTSRLSPRQNAALTRIITAPSKTQENESEAEVEM